MVSRGGSGGATRVPTIVDSGKLPLHALAPIARGAGLRGAGAAEAGPGNDRPVTFDRRPSGMPIETIANFVPLGDRVGTAGQPNEQELREVAAAGYRAVINLGLLDPRYCLPDEAGLAASLGLLYRHIPVNFDEPTLENFRDFVAAMDEYEDKRVLVHCAANYRVSSFMAVYGEMRLGWTREQADRHARLLWPLNDVWTGFLADCRAGFLTD